jgi:aldose 1-epimerase
MEPGKKFCLTNSKGEDIYLFTLSEGGTEVQISNYGAIITSFKVKNNKGSYNDIVLGFDNMEDYWGQKYLDQYPWFGCAVGRYANRIRNAEFEMEGKHYQLSKNRGKHQLHGGYEGFDKKVWKLKSSGDDPFPFIELNYISVDGEEGFPGNLDVILRYELKDHELSYHYTATCDRATPVNLTQHSYFNLNNGEGTINDHQLKIVASRYLEQDKDLVTTGNYIDVAGTAHDFREFYRIDEGLKRVDEYDQSFVLDRTNFGQLELVAELFSESSGTKMQLFSTEPVVHFYSGKWTPEVTGKNNVQYGPFSGLCLETHIHPNAINTPHFPNTVLHPAEIYSQKVIYKIMN